MEDDSQNQSQAPQSRQDRADGRAVDNSKFYKFTEYPGRDAIYNKIVKLYEKKGKAWEQSDSVVFGGFLYHLWDFVPAIFFIWLTWFIVTFTYTHYGEFKAFVALGVMVLIRLNSLLRQVAMTNRLLRKV